MTARLDRALLHPWLGIPLFFVAMFAVFQAVFGLGVPLQDATKWLLDALKTGVVAPALETAPPHGSELRHRRARRRRRHRRDVRAAAGGVLRGDGVRRGFGLPRARRLAHGRADEPPRARRPRVRDAAHGLRLQRPGADGDTRAAQPRGAPPVDARDPVLALLGPAAGLPVPDDGDLQPEAGAGRAVRALSHELRRGVSHGRRLAPQVLESRAAADGAPALPAADAVDGGRRGLPCRLALPAPGDRIHRRGRAA